MDIGKVIQSLRERQNISQKELADKIGISYSVMNRIESGGRPARDDEVIRIAKVLNVSTDYLLGVSDDKNKQISEELPEDFKTPEEAIDFLLNKNILFGFTGFDVNLLSDEDKVRYAEELLEHMKLLSYKYKK